MPEVKTKMDPSEALTRAEEHLRATGYKVKVGGNSLMAADGRDYSTAWCILFFILGILPFLIYWFTRKKNRVMITAGRGRLSITYDGRRGASDATMLVGEIERR